VVVAVGDRQQIAGGAVGEGIGRNADMYLVGLAVGGVVSVKDDVRNLVGVAGRTWKPRAVSEGFHAVIRVSPRQQAVQTGS
jgi:hypothetical protein